MIYKAHVSVLLALGLAVSSVLRCYAQPVRDESLRLGVRATTQYNCKLIHNSLMLTLGYKKSSFFIGPDYTCFFKNYYSHGFSYKKNTLGICFGYDYSFFSKKHYSFFLQTTFSVFPSKYSYYQMGLADWVRHEEWVVQNTLSVGTRYRMANHFVMSLDVGFGSLKGFFLMIDSVVPKLSVSLGFE